jgi:hypothetical protein
MFLSSLIAGIQYRDQRGKEGADNGALAADHARAAIPVQDEQRHGGEPAPRIEGVVADVAAGHPQDGNSGGLGDLAVDAVQVLVYGAGFPAGVGEDRRIQPRQVALGRQQQEGGGLDAGAEGEHAQGW